MPTLIPEKRDSCIRELARWFAEHRKEINFEELTPIMLKHFSETETHEFVAFLDSLEGQEQFKKQLRLEAWKTGEVEPPRPEPEKDFWPSIAKFPLGSILRTRGVSDLAAENDEFAKFAMESLWRHASGDWGDLSEEDKKENELSLRRGFRLLSAYEKYPLPKIWIITEADRSVTTTLFPSEY